MKDQVNDGGPAFPTHGSMGEVVSEGASLRDYFAAKALVGLLKVNRPTDIGAMRQEWADEAYILADAMLRARGAQ